MQLVHYSIAVTDIQMDVVKREQARGCMFDSVCNLVHLILIYLLMFCIIETESSQLLLTVIQVKLFLHIIAKAKGCKLFTIQAWFKFLFSGKCLIKYVERFGSYATQIVLNVCGYFLKKVKSKKKSRFTYQAFS